MILVAGASGQSGSRVLRALASRGLPARALVRSDTAAAKARAAGATEVVFADHGAGGDAQALRAAMHGCEAVFHVAPPMSADEAGIGARMIAAAEAAGVRRFVFQSLVHAQVDALPHHRDKRAVESQLLHARLGYVILQPTMFMQNLQHEWASVQREGVYRQPYSPDVRMGLVDLEDVAEAAATVLADPAFEGGCYELCSGDRLTRHEMADQIAEVLGRPVRAERGDVAAWVARAQAMGTRTDFQIARVLTMFAHYDRHGLAGGSAKVLQMILGRPPRRFRDYLTQLAQERAIA